MNAAAQIAKDNLMTRANVSAASSKDFAAILEKELAKIEARKAPKSAEALERHEASIEGYKAAIAELTAEPVATTESVDATIVAPLVAVVADGEFVGVVSADSNVDQMAKDAGITSFSIVEACGLCSTHDEVPACAKIIHQAQWDEVIESDAGHTGNIVWSIA